jgi:predicted small secreted protein
VSTYGMSNGLKCAAVLVGSVALAGCNAISGADDIDLSDSALVGGDNGPMRPPTPGTQLMECAYPEVAAEYYGILPGKTLYDWHDWEGYIPGQSSHGVRAITDFYDCYGGKGIDAIMFETSGFG